MKTALEIPDTIFRRAKTETAEGGIPFRALKEFGQIETEDQE